MKASEETKRERERAGDQRWRKEEEEEVKAEGSVHHVSVLDVKMPSMKASGGIHLTGSMARPPFL